MRKILTLFLLVTSCILADDRPKLEIHPEDMPEVEFFQHYAVYFFTKHGCPISETGHLAAPIDVVDCKKENILIRSDEFRKAKELAKKIFNLKDKKK